MKHDFLGDSYDAVKRLWCDALSSSAPLYADERFIPVAIQKEFTLLTGIQMLKELPNIPFSILNDPDTGIRLPKEANQRVSRTHTSIDDIAGQLDRTGATCSVTFDQSDYRHGGIERAEQRRMKMRALRELGISSFYYVSHAPFLFALHPSKRAADIKELLVVVGVPSRRLEADE